MKHRFAARFSARVVALILLILLLGISVSCGAEEKVFTAAGMSITLTDDFTARTHDSSYAAAYSSDTIAILAACDPFAAMGSLRDYSVEEYRDFCLSVNDRTDVTMTEASGLVAFEFDYFNEAEGNTYHYLAACYKASDAF